MKNKHQQFALQAERTSLAWYRSIFACLINGWLLLLYALRRQSTLFWVLSLLLFSLAVPMYFFARRPPSSTGGLLLKRLLAAVLAFCSTAFGVSLIFASV